MNTKINTSGNQIITVENSYGHRISVGDKVTHTAKNVRGFATVEELIWRHNQNEVEAYTDRGFAHIDYLRPFQEISVKHKV